MAWQPKSAEPYADPNWTPASAEPLVAVKGHTRNKPTRAERRAAFMAETQGSLPPNPSLGPATNALPMIGSTVGSLAGAPIGAALGLPAGGIGAIPAGVAGRVVGGGIGGGLGELGKEALMGQMPNPAAIGGQAALGAGLGVAGEGVSALATKYVPRWIMQVALRGGPEAADVAIKEGITATKLGVSKMLAKMGQYGQETLRVVRQASRYSKPYDQSAMLKAAYRDTYGDVVPSMTGDELRSLQNSIQKFIGENPKASINATELHLLKQKADQASAAIWDLPIGQRPTPAQQAASGFYQNYANQARMALNETVEGYRASNAPTEALAKLKDVLMPTAKRDFEMSGGARVAQALIKPGVRAGVGGVIGGSLPGDRVHNTMIGAGLGMLGGSPTVSSNLALGLSNPLLALLLQQSPRALGAAYQSASQ